MAQVTGSRTEFDDGVSIPRRVRIAFMGDHVSAGRYLRRNDAVVSIILPKFGYRNEFLHTAYNLFNMPLFSSR